MKNIKKEINKVNWIVLCNTEENLLLNDLYCSAVDLIDTSFKKLTKSIMNQYKLIDKLKIFIKENDNENILELIKDYKHNNDKLYDKLVKIHEDNITKLKKHQLEKLKIFTKKIIPYIYTQKDSILFRKRGVLILNKISAFVNNINNDVIGSYEDIINSLDLEVKTITKNYVDKRTKKDDIIENEDIIKNKKEEFLKIFDYKEMVKLAQNNGYIESRVTGDHLIYTHKDSKKIVVIPAHELRYGLMISIQKQIKENAVL